MKKDYSLKLISKREASELLKKYHYLSKIQRGFKSGINYGLIKKEEIVGVCIFTGFPVPELLKGMFGLPRTEQQGFFELSRLVLDPKVQQEEHNLASWFVARCIKDLRKNNEVRSILSYADNDFHEGIVYKALGFEYYGLSAPKKDFWIKQEDGSYKKHSRGKVKGLEGEWRDRSQKHRYVKIYDETLEMKWEKR